MDYKLAISWKGYIFNAKVYNETIQIMNSIGENSKEKFIEIYYDQLIASETSDDESDCDFNSDSE